MCIYIYIYRFKIFYRVFLGREESEGYMWNFNPTYKGTCDLFWPKEGYMRHCTRIKREHLCHCTCWDLVKFLFQFPPSFCYSNTNTAISTYSSASFFIHWKSSPLRLPFCFFFSPKPKHYHISFVWISSFLLAICGRHQHHLCQFFFFLLETETINTFLFFFSILFLHTETLTSFSNFSFLSLRLVWVWEILGLHVKDCRKPWVSTLGFIVLD